MFGLTLEQIIQITVGLVVAFVLIRIMWFSAFYSIFCGFGLHSYSRHETKGRPGMYISCGEIHTTQAYFKRCTICNKEKCSRIERSK